MTALTSEQAPSGRTAEDSLRKASDQATLIAKRASEAAAAGRRGRPSNEVLASIKDLRRDLDVLSGQLEDAASRLDIRSAVDDHAKRFNAETWPLRARDLRAALQHDQTSGARLWLDAWTEAVVTGHREEAGRLSSEPFALPPEASWWPNRLTVALDALTRGDPKGWAPIGEYLATGAELGGQSSIEPTRVGALLLLEARLRASESSEPSDLDAAQAMVDRAARLLRTGDCNVGAARSAIARHLPTGKPQGPEPADELLSSYSSPGRDTECLAGAVETIQWAAKNGVADEALLSEARLALAPLLPVDLEAQIDALVEHPPDEIWIALAERHRSEGLPDTDRLLDRIKDETTTFFAASERDRLKLALARDSGQSGPTLADVLTQAGSSASSAGRTTEAIAYLEEALALVPDHNGAMLTLADTLVVQASSKPIDQSVEILERARRLCLDAHARSYPTEETSWSMLVLARIDRRAYERSGPGREAAAWRAVLSAARAVALKPDGWMNWSDLAHMLMAAGRHRSADVAARLARRISLDPATTDERRLLTLANIGRNREGLELLDAIENADEPTNLYPAWRLAMRAGFVVEEDPAAALGFIEAALNADPDGGVWYHELRGDCLAIADRRDEAAAEWRWVWQHVELGEYDGLVASARSALKQGLYSTAEDLCAQIEPLQGGLQDLGDAAVIRGLARLATGGDGWGELISALNSKPTAGLLEDVHLLCRVMAKLSPAIDLAKADAAVEQARRRLHDAYADLTPGLQAARELDLGEGRNATGGADDINPTPDGAAKNAPTGDLETSEDIAPTAAAIARALCLIGDGDQQGAVEMIELAVRHPDFHELQDLSEWAQTLADNVVTVLSDEVDEDASTTEEPDDEDLESITIRLGGDWFQQGDLSRDVLRRAVVGAVAFGQPVLRPGRLIPVSDDGLPPDGYSVPLPDGSDFAGTLGLDRWYCPAFWQTALDPDVVKTIVEDDRVPGAVAFRRPSNPDATTSALALRPVDVLARRALIAYAQYWSGPLLPPKPASLVDRVVAWVRRLLGFDQQTS